MVAGQATTPATPATTPATPAAAPAAAGAVPAGITAAKTDVGSLLKSMDQTKLATIPANARAVMKKMPETPADVTMEDRSAIKGCMADANVDKLGKLACSAQDDQLTVVLDKKRVSNANMIAFVKDAMAAGAKMGA